MKVVSSYLLLALTTSIASLAAADFEDAPVASAGAVLPAKLQQSAVHTVDDMVATEGFFYKFRLNSKFGVYNVTSDAGTHPFHGEKNSNWEGAFRSPCFIRWPGRFPAGTTLNGIVSHEDWLPTFAAAAGAPDIKEKLLKGVELNGRTYKNHIDGYNLIDYLSGKTDQSPRHEFIYVGDDGAVMAIRVDNWKATYLENRAHQLQVWREPLVHLRMPLLFNLRRDPFEKAYQNSNTYHDWMIDRAYVLGPMQMVASKFLTTMKEYPPSQTPGDWSLSTLEKQLKRMTSGD